MLLRRHQIDIHFHNSESFQFKDVLQQHNNIFHKSIKLRAVSRFVRRDALVTMFSD